jgi:hypothetical protein
MPAPSGQIPPPWAWWESEAPATRAARSSSQAQLSERVCELVGPTWSVPARPRASPARCVPAGSRVYAGDRRRTWYDAARRRDTTEDTMTTTPGNASRNLPGKPPVVDLATWQAARDELLVLALGRRRRRHLGPDQPPGAAVDPPWRDPRGDPRPARPPPLTGLCRRRRQRCYYDRGMRRRRRYERVSEISSSWVEGRTLGPGSTERRAR